MPTVRELKNRITFDVDKSTVSNAENTFGKLKKGAGAVISVVKGVGAAIVSVTALASKQFIDLEKDIGATNFFSRSKEDAEDLLKITQEIAKISVTTSKKEAGQASAILSQIPGIEQFRKELLPILEEISIANPKLDFTGVTEAFSQLVKDGNLEELRNLLPGSAELLEKLGLSTFNFADRTKTAANRTQLFLEQMQKQRGELKRLADEQRKTERFQAEGVAKETSDFITNFGATTAGPMTELFKEIRLTIKELNESESFWNNVRATAEAVLAAFKFVKGVGGAAFVEAPKETLTGGNAPIGNLQLPQSIIEQQKEKPSFLEFIGATGGPKNKAPSRFGGESLSGGSSDININGRLEVDVKGGDGVDGGQIADGIMRTVQNGLKEKMRNIAAQNGKVVANGGGL